MGENCDLSTYILHYDEVRLTFYSQWILTKQNLNKVLKQNTA